MGEPARWMQRAVRMSVGAASNHGTPAKRQHNGTQNRVEERREQVEGIFPLFVLTEFAKRQAIA